MKHYFKKLVSMILAVILITGTLSTMFAPVAGAEVSISGEFTKSKYTVELGGSFSVNVEASVSGASLTRVTVNVHNGSNERLASKAVSGTGWSGRLTVDTTEDSYLSKPGTYDLKLYVAADAGSPNFVIADYATLVIEACSHSKTKEYIYEEYRTCYKANSEQHRVSYIYDETCLNCGEQIANMGRKEYLEDHDFDSEGVCEGCGYEDSDMCTHRKTKTVTNGLVSAVSISNTMHRVVYKADVICNGCNKVVEVTTVTREENHLLDANGDCDVCDLRTSCKHANPVKRVESTINKTDEDYHYTYEIGHWVCSNANCSKQLDPFQDEIKEKHTFKKGVCSTCGYKQERDPLSVTIARGQASAQTGSSISASVTVTGGSGDYSYVWWVYRNGSSVNSSDFADDAYSYTAKEEGSYYFKVCVTDRETGEQITKTTDDIKVEKAPCAHSSEPLKEITNTTYHRYSDTHHEIRDHYQMVCKDCGKIISSGSYDKSYAEHNVNSSDTCICGYVKPTETCKHTSSKAQKVGEPTLQQYDQNRHYILTIYQDVCAGCGEVMNAHREEKTFEDHSFTGSKCACGYVKPEEKCDHAEKTSQQIGSAKVEPHSDTHHRVIRYYKDICANSKCGVVLNDKREDVQHVAHQFGADNKCECGYVKKVTVTTPPTQAPTGKPEYSEPETPPTQVPVTQAPTGKPEYSEPETPPTQVPVTQAPTGKPEYSEPETPPTQVPVTQAPITQAPVTQPPVSEEEQCDHKPECVDSKVVIEKINGDGYHHTAATVNRLRCKCGKVDYEDIVRKPVDCTFDYEGVQDEHEAQGHRHFVRCSACRNAHTIDKFKTYLSSCPTCLSIGLGRGCKGEEVKQLQEKLNKLGAGLTVDGIFGGGTESAVKSFQISVGLDPSGIVDATTQACLNEECQKKLNEKDANADANKPTTPAQPDSGKDNEGVKEGNTQSGSDAEKPAVSVEDPIKTANKNFAEDTSNRQLISDLRTKQGASIAYGTADDVLNELSEFNLGKTIGQFISNPVDAAETKTLSKEKEKMMEELLKATMDRKLDDSPDPKITVDDISTLVEQGFAVAEEAFLVASQMDGISYEQFWTYALNAKTVNNVADKAGTVFNIASVLIEFHKNDKLAQDKKEQLFRLVLQQAENERYLQSIISSTTDVELKYACLDVLEEIRSAVNDCYDAIHKQTFRDDGAAVVSALASKVPGVGWATMLTKGENAMFNAADDMITYVTVRDAIYSTLGTEASNKGSASYDLFQLYKEAELLGYDLTEEYYESYQQSAKGGFQDLIGTYDHDAMLDWIYSDRSDFVEDCAVIEKKWQECYNDAAARTKGSTKNSSTIVGGTKGGAQGNTTIVGGTKGGAK